MKNTQNSYRPNVALLDYSTYLKERFATSVLRGLWDPDYKSEFKNSPSRMLEAQIKDDTEEYNDCGFYYRKASALLKLQNVKEAFLKASHIEPHLCQANGTQLSVHVASRNKRIKII